MRLIFKILGFTLLALTSLSGLLFWHLSPILKSFDPPTGPYVVGSYAQPFVDEYRHESHAQDLNAKRKILITWYYPTSQRKITQATYPYQPTMLAALKKRFTKTSWLPSFVWNCVLNNIKTYVIPNASLAESNQPYPIILFSHGIGSYNLYETYLAELASWGYLVVAVTHPYDTEVTAFPNGSVIELSENLEFYMKQMLRSEIYTYRVQAHKTWLSDLTFILNTLEKLNEDATTQWLHKLDLDRIGVFGHSHGGWVAADLCAQDSRIKAGINCDGWTRNVPIKKIAKPFLFLENGKGMNDVPEIQELCQAEGSLAQRAAIPATEHGAFCDLIYHKEPLAWYFKYFKGNKKLIDRHIRNFFDKHLKQ